MTRPLLLFFTLMPLLSFGQNNNRFLNTGNRSELTVETTLINDTELYKTITPIEVPTRTEWSLTSKDLPLYQWIDEQKLNQMLLEVKPLIDLKLQWIQPAKSIPVIED